MKEPIGHHKVGQGDLPDPVSFLYSTYGLQLSLNVPISRLRESGAPSPTDVRVTLGQRPSWFSDSIKKEESTYYRDPDADENGTPRLVVTQFLPQSYFRLVYADGAEFVIDCAGTRVWGTWLDKLSVEDAIVYLLGPIMGFVMRRRGFALLHGSAVAVSGRAIALVGPPRAGKSTTAAAFAEMGYPVVSDDIVRVTEHGDSFLAQPGYPCLCLWPNSVSALYGSPEALPLLTPTWDKRYLPLGDERHLFRAERLPLAAIYLLDRREAQSGRPRVASEPASAAFFALLGNTYMNFLPNAGIQSREFESCSRLAECVPVRRVQPHGDPAYLKRLCEVILDDFSKVEPPATPANGASQDRDSEPTEPARL